MTRKYNHEADFHLIVAAATKEMSLAAVKNEFDAAGLEWPNLNNGGPYASLVDHDICRVWGTLRIEKRREDELASPL